MGRGKKHSPEQVVNLLRQIEDRSGGGERKDHCASMQRGGDRGADVLPVA
jgi:hypothetical protein